MNDQQQILIDDLLALLGRKELEIYMLRKAFTQFQNQPVPPDGPQPPSDGLGPLAHHPV